MTKFSQLTFGTILFLFNRVQPLWRADTVFRGFVLCAQLLFFVLYHNSTIPTYFAYDLWEIQDNTKSFGFHLVHRMVTIELSVSTESTPGSCTFTKFYSM